MLVIYLNTASGEGQKVFEVVPAADCPPLTLVAISGLNWNRNMAHWDGPAAFKRGSLSAGARMTTGGCWWRRSCQKQKRTWLGLRHGGDHRVLSGGTICGVCHLSDGCVLWGCMSGSVWFPGFKEYIFSRELKRRPDCIYFSLGGQGNQDLQLGSENGSREYGRNSELLSG